MRSVSAKRSKAKLSFTLPTEVHAEAVKAAQSLNLSLSAWLTFIVGGAVRRWRPPVKTNETQNNG
jgi:predicted HicB family RNase H-like nuclease